MPGTTQLPPGSQLDDDLAMCLEYPLKETANE